MKFAYADPPYIGQAKKHYDSKEVNHEKLIEELNGFDSWALSCSSPTLREILILCPKDVRIMPWVKPFASFKPNVNPAYAWEPVITRGHRKRERFEKTIRDWVSCNITLKKGLSGVKPDTFSFWLFDVMGLLPKDGFYDLFPGTGAVTKAWIKWKDQFKLKTLTFDMITDAQDSCRVDTKVNYCPLCKRGASEMMHEKEVRSMEQIEITDKNIAIVARAIFEKQTGIDFKKATHHIKNNWLDNAREMLDDYNEVIEIFTVDKAR